MEEVIGFVVKLKDLASTPARAIAKAIMGIGHAMIWLTKQAWRAQKATTTFLKKTAKGARQTAIAFASVSQALNEAAGNMSRITQATAGNMFKAAIGGIAIAAEVESSNLRLGFSLKKLGKDYESTREKIDEVSLSTSITRRELTDMVSGLALQKIDTFHSAVADMNVTFQDGTETSVSAVDVLNDAISFSGKTAKRVMTSVREAVSEQSIRPARWLADDLNVSKTELKEWNKALQDGKTPQESFNNLMLVMAQRVGGMTAAIKDSLNFVLKQVGDWRDKLSDELFRDALPVIASFLRDVGKEFIKMVKDDHFAPIRDAITSTVEGIMMLGRGLLWVTKLLVEFFRAFPALIPILTALAGIMVAFTGIAIAAAAVIAPLLAFGALVALIPTILLGLKMMAIAFLVLAPLVAVFAGLVAMVGLLTANFVKAKSIGDFFTKWKILILAVVEGVKNLNGEITTLSLETTAKLEKHGLVKQFMILMQTLIKLKNAAIAFKDGMKAVWPDIVDAMAPALASVMEFGDIMGNTMGAKNKKDDLHSWDGWGNGIARIIGGVMVIMTHMFALVIRMVTWVARAMYRFGQLSAAEYGEVIGMPDSFKNLSEDSQEKVLDGYYAKDKRTQITQKYAAGARLLGRPSKHLENYKEKTDRGHMYEGLTLAMRENIDAFDNRKGNQKARVDAMTSSLKNLGTAAPASALPMTTSTTIAGMGIAGQRLALQALSDNKIDKAEFKKLGESIGKGILTFIQKHPILIKAKLEGLVEPLGDVAAEIEEEDN